MHKCCQVVLDQVIKTTVSQPELKEVGITELVSADLKRKKVGMFQNEVDYRSLFPGFLAPENIPSRTEKFRADLAGFAGGSLVLFEYKIYNEEIRTSGPWKVLYYLLRDRLKLEAAIQSNEGRLPGFAMQVCAVRNTDFSEHREQTNIMSQGFVQENGRAKSIRGARYFPILPAFDKYTREESRRPWSFFLQKHGSVAFLVGVTPL